MIPKPLRDQIGLRPGVVEVVVEGAGLRAEPVAVGDLTHEDGQPVIPASGQVVDDELVRALRLADQR